MEGLASSSAALGASTRNDSLLDLCGPHSPVFRRLRRARARGLFQIVLDCVGADTAARFLQIVTERSQLQNEGQRTTKSDMREATT
jgi:hypothetical protein